MRTGSRWLVSWMAGVSLTVWVPSMTLAAAGPRLVIPLASGWEFHQGEIGSPAAADTAAWEPVSIPHTWNRTDAQSGGEMYQGTGWYRLPLTLDPAWKGRRLFVRFEGVGQVADVYVNGTAVTHHDGAYSAFAADITPAVRWDGPNTLMVRADNAPRPDVIPINTNLFMVYGGVYRPVALVATDPVHVSVTDHASPGVFISQRDVSAASADITVRVKLENQSPTLVPASLRVSVTDTAGAVVASHEQAVALLNAGVVAVAQDLHVASPTLWHGRRNPYLYTVTVEVLRDGRVADRVEQPLGLRSYRIDPERGFFLNGEPYPLHGITRHQEWQDCGSALADRQHQADLDIMYEIGATTLRLAHYQQAEYMYAAADRMGFIVWAEIPWVNRSSGAEGANARQQLTELIRQNANHPSIVFWGLHNEVYAKTATDFVVRLTRELHDLAKTEDPARYTIAVSGYGDLDKPANWQAELQGINRYFGWYDGEMGDLGPWMDRVKAERPHGFVALAEYGTEGNPAQQAEDIGTHEDPITGQFFPEGYQARLHEVQWAAISRAPHIFASYIWAGFDFAVPGWDRGGVKARNQKGLVTYDRSLKKDAYYFYKANWSESPVLYIAGRRLATRTEAVSAVTVYANVGQVTLFVNGRRVDGRQPGGSKGHLVWPRVALKMGPNELRVTGMRGGQVFEDRVSLTRVAPRAAER